MPLNKKLDAIRILFQGFGISSQDRVEYEVVVQDTDISVDAEYFKGGSLLETVGATKISNIRGYRVVIDLSYNSAREYVRRAVGTGNFSTSTYRTMFNEVVACFGPDGKLLSLPSVDFKSMHVRIIDSTGAFAVITESDSSSSFLEFVPDGIRYEQRYSNQIGRFVPSLSLISKRLLPSIPSELEGVL